ncbi:MAG: alpha-1,2-fucosyltransferase [Patescibacteria group bacterium]
MIIVKIIGGLGNQMFQYALGFALAKKNNTNLKLDISGFAEYKLHRYSLNNFNIHEEIATQSEIAKLKDYTYPTVITKLREIIGLSVIRHNPCHTTEIGYNFYPEILKLPDNIYLEGYWQSEKYFIDIMDLIKQDFTIKSKPVGLNLSTLNKINSTNSISVHIRRGDYVTDQKTNQFHGTCQIDYYKMAAKLLSEKVVNPVFFIFSDDPEWVKTNLKLEHAMVFVTHNNSEKNYEDVRLMSRCQHNIIANSTFSWWGAWLNNNPGKIVIAPNKWFTDPKMNTEDLLSSAWIKI